VLAHSLRDNGTKKKLSRTLSSVIVADRRESTVMSTASFFFVPLSLRECASTAAPVLG